MTTTKGRLGGGSLALRLTALVIVPMIALSTLAIRRIDEGRAAASEAAALFDEAALRQSIAAVFAPAQTERIALEGLARIDELGVPREVVVDLAGVDFQTVYDANLIEFEHSLDSLTASYASMKLSDGNTLSDRLMWIRGSLQVQRELSRQLLATQPDISAVFDELSLLLDDAVRQSPVPSVSSQTFRSNRAQLDALTQVLSSAGASGTALMQGLILRGPEQTVELVTQTAAHQAHLDVFAATLDTGDLPEFDQVRAILEPIPENLISGVAPGDDASVIDPVVIAASARSILNLVDYLDALDQYSNRFHLNVLAETNDLAKTAESEGFQTLLMVSIIAVVSMALIALILWSTLAPLRRLNKRAMQISDGDLAGDPLPLRGPRDIRSLTFTVNNMMATLQLVDDQVSRLASGDAPVASTAEVPGAIGVSIRDSVDRLSTVTAQLHRSEQLASAIVTQAADAIWTVAVDGSIRSANDASASITGVANTDQVGLPLRDFLTTLDGEATIRGADGTETRVLVAHSAIDAGPEPIVAVIARDISERSRYEKRLAHQARHDALTGLPNRFAVLEYLTGLLARPGNKVGVLFVDVDGFKSVNDTHGHAAGDRVLKEVANRLSKWVRPTEFVARLGGDEFLVVVDGFDEVEDVVAFGYRLIREVEQPYDDGEEMFALSASIGVSIPDRSMSALDAIVHADNAVYLAKRRGRGRVETFDADLQASIEQQAEIELALRHGIRNDELVVHLQPTFDVQTGIVQGAEALVRWNRPGVGLVPPDQFIPIAERSSLIYELERWVLAQSCHRLAEWRKYDPNCTMRIAVNISGRHLIEGELIHDVDAALADSGADPNMLELELTETQLLGDLVKATEILRQSPCARHHDRGRRLRNRLLVDDVPAPSPCRLHQDRPELRGQGHRRRLRLDGGRSVADHRTNTAPERGRRGRGDRRATRVRSISGM